ncbi:MAG: hypothetical protein ACI9SG_002849 [Maribacter sp.]|jgi:hypothetical protein
MNTPTITTRILKKFLLVLCFVFISSSCNKDDNNGVPPITEEEETIENNPLGLELQSEFTNEQDYRVVADGIFAIWWDPRFDHENDIPFMLDTFKTLRQDCLNNLGMKDPPNVAAGVFFNIYIHHGERDNLPNGWGNGVGTNSFGVPYMTLPEGAHADFNNLLHEGFHIFQYSNNSPGFAYDGDTSWYTEATAQWYAVSRNPNAFDTFIEIGTLTSNPHLALWHSFGNEAPGDPTDWLYQVRQYAMQAWLYYMTSQESVAENLITDGYYSGTNLSPQEYHYQNIGSERLREIFANWAARNTLDFDYLTRQQVARARIELNDFADFSNNKPYALTLSGTNFIGTHNAPADLKPRSWAYNVIKLENIPNGNYTISLNGEDEGSEGAASHFEGRFVTKGQSQVQSFTMNSATNGSFNLTLENPVEEAYIIIASVPEQFKSAQNYGYSITISQ